MKENSREDRINNAYCFLNSMHSDFRTGLYYKEDLENLEHILSDYKRVLKENEELKADNYELNNRINDLLDNIPVQKVKDKIEELQNGPLKINENNKYYYETEAYNKIIIQVLQELLEGRK